MDASNGVAAIIVKAGASAVTQNSADISVGGQNILYGIQDIGVTSALTVNSGTIKISAAGSIVYAVETLASAGNAVTRNSGSIDVTGGNVLYGVFTESTNATAATTNYGAISVTGASTLSGIYTNGKTAASTSNHGSVTLNGEGNGIFSQAATGAALVQNFGTVTLIGGTTNRIGLEAAATTSGDATIVNTGRVQVAGGTGVDISAPPARARSSIPVRSSRREA